MGKLFVYFDYKIYSKFFIGLPLELYGNLLWLDFHNYLETCLLFIGETENWFIILNSYKGGNSKLWVLQEEFS